MDIPASGLRGECGLVVNAPVRDAESVKDSDTQRAFPTARQAPEVGLQKSKDTAVTAAREDGLRTGEAMLCCPWFLLLL